MSPDRENKCIFSWQEDKDIRTANEFFKQVYTQIRYQIRK